MNPSRKSLNAERQRRWRQRQRQCLSVIQFELSDELLDQLIEQGFIDAARCGDKRALGDIVRRIVEKKVTRYFQPHCEPEHVEAHDATESSNHVCKNEKLKDE